MQLIISLKHRFIFIKGVKVGGTSIETHLSNVLEEDAVIAKVPGDLFPSHKHRNYLSPDGTAQFIDHMSATAVRSVIGTWLYERLYKFGVIRNPFEKIISLFAMHHFDNPSYTLDKAIAECESEKTLLCDGDSMIVHRAIFYESLNAQLKEVLDQLGVPFSGNLTYNERSESRQKLKNLEFHLSPIQIQEILEKFKFEFDLYAAADRRIVTPEPGVKKIGSNKY